MRRFVLMLSVVSVVSALAVAPALAGGSAGTANIVAAARSAGQFTTLTSLLRKVLL